MTLTVYNRRVTKLSDLTQNGRMNFYVTASNLDLDPTLISRGMERCVGLYLEGSGHPPEWLQEGLISDLEDARAKADPLFRAKLLLKALTDSDLMPTDPEWHIMVNIPVIYFTSTHANTHVVLICSL